MEMNIILASDHAGYKIKKMLKDYLVDLGGELEDAGTYTEDSVDYPDYAEVVGERVSKGEMERGILICGSGLGMAIVANKFPNVRACPCHSVEEAKVAREHNDCNVLCLGARFNTPEEIKEIVKTWYQTAFGQERHIKRLEKIHHLEQRLKR